MNIVAIIVTYNGSKWISNCFESLKKSTIPIKVLAIDNASTDNTPNLIREHYPEVEVIETGQNLGFGKANNIGLKRVLEENADFAFLLNQDAWVEPDTIEKLITISNENSQYGILSPIHLNGEGNGIDYNYSNYLAPKNTPDFYSDLFFNKLKPIYNTKFVNAAAWLVTLKCIQKVGGFDPIFSHYGEDDDYIYRTTELHKFKIGVVPSAFIYHDREIKDFNPKSLFNINKLDNSLKLYLKRHSNPLPAKHFLIRKLIFNKLLNLLLFFNMNTELKQENERIIKTFKLIKIIKKRRQFETNSTMPYI